MKINSQWQKVTRRMDLNAEIKVLQINGKTFLILIQKQPFKNAKKSALIKMTAKCSNTDTKMNPVLSEIKTNFGLDLQIQHHQNITQPQDVTLDSCTRL